MREILFHGKRTDNGEWVEGSSSTEYLKECGGVMISPRADTCYRVDPETVGQYTGLKDKNGVRIFEGDIVRYGDTIHQVVFEQRNTTAYFGLVYSKIETMPFGHYQDLKQIEVIGNIHDNPELLETAAKPVAKNIAQSGLVPATENFELMEG